MKSFQEGENCPQFRVLDIHKLGRFRLKQVLLASVQYFEIASII